MDQVGQLFGIEYIIDYGVKIFDETDTFVADAASTNFDIYLPYPEYD